MNSWTIEYCTCKAAQAPMRREAAINAIRLDVPHSTHHFQAKPACLSATTKPWNRLLHMGGTRKLRVHLETKKLGKPMYTGIAHPDTQAWLCSCIPSMRWHAVAAEMWNHHAPRALMLLHLGSVVRAAAPTSGFTVSEVFQGRKGAAAGSACRPGPPCEQAALELPPGAAGPASSWLASPRQTRSPPRCRPPAPPPPGTAAAAPADWRLPLLASRACCACPLGPAKTAPHPTPPRHAPGWLGLVAGRLSAAAPCLPCAAPAAEPARPAGACWAAGPGLLPAPEQHRQPGRRGRQEPQRQNPHLVL